MEGSATSGDGQAGIRAVCAPRCLRLTGETDLEIVRPVSDSKGKGYDFTASGLHGFGLFLCFVCAVLIRA